MSLKHPNKLVNILLDYLQEKKISVVKFAAEAAIPKDRVYKWGQENTNPKADDVTKIKSWLTKKGVEVPPTVIGKNGDVDSGGTIHSFNTDAQKTLSEHEQRLLRAEAMLEVYESAIAGLLSEKKGDFTRKVVELRDEVTKVVNRRFDELLNKRG